MSRAEILGTVLVLATVGAFAWYLDYRSKVPTPSNVVLFPGVGLVPLFADPTDAQQIRSRPKQV